MTSVSKQQYEFAIYTVNHLFCVRQIFPNQTQIRIFTHNFMFCLCLCLNDATPDHTQYNNQTPFWHPLNIKWFSIHERRSHGLLLGFSSNRRLRPAQQFECWCIDTALCVKGKVRGVWLLILLTALCWASFKPWHAVRLCSSPKPGVSISASVTRSWGTVRCGEGSSSHRYR